MRNYRIRQKKTCSIVREPEIFEVGNYTVSLPEYKEKVSTIYVVERRFLWFWWIKSSLYASEFKNYEDAVFYVKHVRNGNLLFTI
jgi:hypothetical protein